MGSFKKTLLASLLLLCACAKEDSGSAGATEERKNETTIQGKSAEEYYNQFIYYIEGDCKKGYAYEHYLAGRSILIGKDSTGRDLRANFKVKMQRNHTFTAAYEEQAVIRYTEGGMHYKIVGQKEISGTWSIDKEKILFEGLGQGVSLKYNDVESINLKFSTDLISPGLAMSEFIFSMHSSSVDEKEFIEFCKNK